jgi:hypothetical protein
LPRSLLRRIEAGAHFLSSRVDHFKKGFKFVLFLLVTNFIFATNISALYVRLCSYVARLLAPARLYRLSASSRRCRVRASSMPSATVRSR